jgi:hypothetical protein
MQLRRDRGTVYDNNNLYSAQQRIQVKIKLYKTFVQMWGPLRSVIIILFSSRNSYRKQTIICCFGTVKIKIFYTQIKCRRLAVNIYCDMITWSIVRQRLCKHVSATTDTHATIEKLLEAVPSVRSAPRLHNEGRRKRAVTATNVMS